MMIDTDQLSKLSLDEKLELMEAVCAELAKHQDRIESPAWHEQELKKTDQRIADGLEEPIEWEEAKRILKDRLK